MDNTLKIKPLLQYEVGIMYADRAPDVFTADEMIRDEKDVVFRRTGNTIRVYTDAPSLRIIVTPVDENAEVQE